MVENKAVQIEDSWYELLKEEFQQPHFQAIRNRLLQDKAKGIQVYPPGRLIFNAFNLVPLDKVKVVIIGQDPYHNPGAAMGLSFSVPNGVKIPPSLRNIYKELNRDIDFRIPEHGDLTKWAKQGVFLLNAMLTVEHKKAGSHQKIGWQLFTDAVISKLSDEKKRIIFMLWGNFAKSKKDLIDENKHVILEAYHPSPLAGNRFQGCGHFSKTNEVLINNGQQPIDWSL